MSFSAVILAGGKSSRMGRDKALLKVDGKTLLARQIELSWAAGASEIFISGRADADYSRFRCRVLRDRFIGAGPLAGIEHALATTITPLLLVLAVDLPAMSLEFVQHLAANCAESIGAIPRVNGQIEPLAAFYPKAAQPLAETLLHDKDNAASTFSRQCVQCGLARFFDAPASQALYFANWNSPAEVGCAGHNFKVQD